MGGKGDMGPGLLERINEGYYNEGYDVKINNIKMNSVSSRRKD